MKSSRIIIAGIFAGAVFYALSLIVRAGVQFLPVIPLAITIPASSLGGQWQLVHAFVSLMIGLFWAAGYYIYGAARKGGWRYGATIYLVGTIPAAVVWFILAGQARMVVVYSAIVSLVGALLAGKLIERVMQR